MPMKRATERIGDETIVDRTRRFYCGARDRGQKCGVHAPEFYRVIAYEDIVPLCARHALESIAAGVPVLDWRSTNRTLRQSKGE